MKTLTKLLYYFLIFCLGIYVAETRGSCQTNNNHPMLESLCGTDVPISDTVFYENHSKEEVFLYRVWNQEHPTSKIGRWWSLDNPMDKAKSEYRKDNAICPEWSPLDAVVRCKLKKGSQFMIGRTEAVQCKVEYYESNDTLQIFLIDPWMDINADSCETWNWP